MWITNSRVDSYAMFKAYSKFQYTQHKYHEHLGIRNCLTCIVHACSGNDPFFNIVTVIPCEQKGCQRCANGLAGFTFRWFSALWHDDYLKFCRDGSWVPGKQGSRIWKPGWDPRDPTTWLCANPLRGFDMNHRGEFLYEEDNEGSPSTLTQQKRNPNVHRVGSDDTLVSPGSARLPLEDEIAGFSLLI